jgi:amino acid transporter
LVLLALLAYWIYTGHALGWQHIKDPALSEQAMRVIGPRSMASAPSRFCRYCVAVRGVEVQAVHVMDMRSPSRGYPAAIGLGAVISILIFALGALPIAGILPYEKISLQSGVFDTLRRGHHGHLAHAAGWSPSLSLLVGVGAISGVLAWLGSPSRGLLETAHEGELPPMLQAKTNKECPRISCSCKGLIVTLMSCFYFVIKDVSVAFFLISAMTIALYLIAYMFMYAAAIKLRYSQPDLNVRSRCQAESSVCG